MPLLDWVGWDDWGYNGVVSLATDPVEPEPGLRRGRHVHQRLGPEQRRDPALRRPRRDLAGAAAAVQARRQHARPRHGRAARRRPQPQQRPLLRRAQRQRPVAQHRLRRHLGEGDRLPQPRQLRAGPERPQRLPQRQPGRRVGDLRRDDGHRAARATQTIYVGVADKENTVYRSTDARRDLGARSPASRPGTSRTRACSTRRRLALPRHQRHRRPVRRRQGRRVAVRDRDRRLDPDQPAPVDRAPTTTSATAA